MANVVLVADMVRGFVEPAHDGEKHNLYFAQARAIIPNVRRLLEEEQARGSHVIFMCDTHDPDDKEFEMFPPHCIRGSVECEVIPELEDIPGQRMAKNRYSAFINTPLEQRLVELHPDRVIVVGVCTDICVLHTTAHARSRDYAVEVPADCVATFDDEAHAWALKHMQEILGAKVVASGVGERTKG